MNEFTIVLPVRNGGEYLKDCVSSILSQTYPYFNLVVLENASTDGTAEWLATLNDKRLTVLPSLTPLSIEENWHRIVAIEKNEFVTTIGHDDLLSENYFSGMNQLIANFPKASLYQSRCNIINRNSQQIRLSKPLPETLSGPHFLELLLRNGIDLMGTGFVMRSALFDSFGGLPSYPNLLFADFELFVKLAGLSGFSATNDVLFSFRIHSSTTTTSSDLKMIAGFKRLILFLNNLKSNDAAYAKVIQESAAEFLLNYCKGLSHRLLRTALDRRGNLTVKQFANDCRNFGQLLEVEPRFEPLDHVSIRLAVTIDSNKVFRSAFLLFKKLVPKPLMK